MRPAAEPVFVPFSKTAEPEPVLWVVVGAVLRFWTRVASWSGVSDMAVRWRRVAAIVFVSGGWGTEYSQGMAETEYSRGC